MASVSTLWFLKSRLDANSRLFNVKFNFGHNILYLKLKLYVKLRFVKSWLYCTVKSRFNEWPPSAPFCSLNRDFTLNRDFLRWNFILVTRFHILNRDFSLNRDSINWDLTVHTRVEITTTAAAEKQEWSFSHLSEFSIHFSSRRTKPAHASIAHETKRKRKEPGFSPSSEAANGVQKPRRGAGSKKLHTMYICVHAAAHCTMSDTPIVCIVKPEKERCTIWNLTSM